MPSKVEEFRIDLTDEYVDYYNSIKEINNIDKKVDVFRYAIETAYKLDMEGVTPYTVIPQNLRNRIKKYVSREDVQNKFNIYRYEDFLQKGIKLLMEEIETYINSRSILHWDIRNSLTGDKKEVAIVIKELLMENPHGEVSFEKILEHLGWRDQNRLKEILDTFVYQNLLESEFIGNKRIYHAKLSL